MSNPVEAINESQAAGKVMLEVTRAVNDSIGPLSGWLAAGVGASLALLVANIDAVSEFVAAGYIRFALSCLLFSLLTAIVSKLVSAWISAQISAHEAGLAIGKQITAGSEPFSYTTFISEFEKALLPHVRWISRRMMRNVVADPQYALRLTAKVSQCQPVLVTCEVVAVAVAVVAVVIGLKP